MPPTITEAFPPLPLPELVDLVSGFEGMALAEKRGVIERLVQVHPLISMNWGHGWRFRRCRKLEPGNLPAHVDELIWRKDAPAQLGRANPAGYQVIYLADRQDTALTEARVTQHPVAVAEFVIREGKTIRLAPIGELAQVQQTGRGFLSGDVSAYLSDALNACSRDDGMSLAITDAFLLNCLTGHDDYELSSHVALCAFDKNPAISAIAYPSRRQRGAINFAVRVDGFWDAWGLSGVRYGQARHLAMGYFNLLVSNAVDGIFNDGRLQWCAMDGVSDGLWLDPPYFDAAAT